MKEVAERGELSPNYAGRPTPRLHHVNLGVLPGGIESESKFLTEVLGYRQLVLEDWLRELGAVWFETTDGTQVHLSVDADHRAAAEAHTAVEYGDKLSEVEEVLAAHGVATTFAMAPGNVKVVFCADPAGNRWELRGFAAAE